MLRFTIVIPNYNSGLVLERAIRSVLDQNYENLQLILADNNSRDESAAIVERYRKAFDPLIRRDDEGQAEALNYAFRQAKGDVFGWLPADDEILPGALHHVAGMFDRDEKADVVAGASERVFEGHFRNYVPVPREAWDVITTQNVFDQPAVFWRSALHRRLGELDTTFKLAFDWDFWCRMRAARARLVVTERALARYYFSGLNKSSVAGHQHVVEGTRVVRRHGPLFGRIASVYGFLYRNFDLHGCMDDPPACSSARLRVYKITRAALKLALGPKKIERYNWHFASLQERKLEWWDYKRPKLEELRARSGMTENQNIQDWKGGTSQIGPDDTRLPDSLDHVNVVLNRRRLRRFLDTFSTDADVRDFLLLDSLGQCTGLPISSTGLVDFDSNLAHRPFRVWEYVWIFKALQLRGGGLRVLDIGGPLSHIVFLSALAGNDVLTIDVDSKAVDACNRTAQSLGLKNLRAELGDMRKLERLSDSSFDRVLSCSVLEHLTGADQTTAMREMARVLKRDGGIGLTFDYGEGAASANIHLPPPHEPPATAADILKRLVTPDLSIIGNAAIEEPIPDSLFNSTLARYTVASLFLAKEAAALEVPRPLEGPSILGNLAIPGLADMAHAAASASSTRRQREEAEKQSWVTQFNQLNEQIAIFEEAAQQRLVMLERVHAEAAVLREESEKRMRLIQQLSKQ